MTATAKSPARRRALASAVRALDGVVDDAHAEPFLRTGEGLLDEAHADGGAQIADPFDEPQRDVDRMSRRQSGPAQVRDPGARAPGLAAGPLAPTAATDATVVDAVRTGRLCPFALVCRGVRTPAAISADNAFLSHRAPSPDCRSSWPFGSSSAPDSSASNPASRTKRPPRRGSGPLHDSDVAAGAGGNSQAGEITSPRYWRGDAFAQSVRFVALLALLASGCAHDPVHDLAGAALQVAFLVAEIALIEARPPPPLCGDEEQDPQHACPGTAPPPPGR